MAEAHHGAALVIGNTSCETAPANGKRLLPSRVLQLGRAAKVSSCARAAIVTIMATQRASLEHHQLSSLEAALVMMQAHASAMPKVWMLTMSSPTHQGVWGLARSARAEASLPVHCLDGAVTAPHQQLQMLTEPEAVQRSAVAFLVPRLAHAPQWAHTGVYPSAAAHVVTGGTGGLGMLTARWLSQRGPSRALMLASRSGVLARDMAAEWAGMLAATVTTLVQQCAPRPRRQHDAAPTRRVPWVHTLERAPAPLVPAGGRRRAHPLRATCL